MEKNKLVNSLTVRDRPFNLKGGRGGGGGYGFLFLPEFFFRTIQELENVSSTKIRIFFSATLGIRIFF